MNLVQRMDESLEQIYYKVAYRTISSNVLMEELFDDSYTKITIVESPNYQIYYHKDLKKIQTRVNNDILPYVKSVGALDRLLSECEKLHQLIKEYRGISI